ncbi:hypothetical protein RB2150_16804 [Rhodobacterales bacterium HTCC2150]|nr:hypothetical protein RB2150_16804 [Rhodobacterales bacterium HTCC2150] [Rhodobacteraceae bacterium HTCC2150]
MVAFASETLRHDCGPLLVLATFYGLEIKTADRAAATARSAELPLYFQGVQLRVPPGGMSARMRVGSSSQLKADACMKPCFALFGVLCFAPIICSVFNLPLRDAMGIHGNQYKNMGTEYYTLFRSDMKNNI